jgi:hypothetical protein
MTAVAETARGDADFLRSSNGRHSARDDRTQASPYLLADKPWIAEIRRAHPPQVRLAGDLRFVWTLQIDSADQERS